MNTQFSKPLDNPVFAAIERGKSLPPPVLKTSPKLTRQERIWLACCYYGWYTFGLAVGQSERTDEDCAVDNNRVPRYEHQLNAQQKAIIEKCRSSKLESEQKVVSDIYNTDALFKESE